MRHAIVSTLVAVTLLVGSASGVRADGLAKESARVLATGRAARDAGDLEGARRRFEEALALAPGSTETLGELLALDAGDADARALWTLELARSGVDLAGRWKPDRALDLDKNDVAAPAQAVRLRTKALQTVRKTLPRLKGAGDVAALRVLAAWSRALSGGYPALAAGHDEGIAAAAARVRPDEDGVIAALDAVMRRAASGEDWATALRAGLLLRGIDRQGREDAADAGPPSKIAQGAIRVIERARRELTGGGPVAPPQEGEEAPEPEDTSRPRVHTIEELYAIPAAEIAAWNARHRTWEHPAIAVTPNGLYRVETTCGWNTLAAVAESAEDLHAQIATWIGQDPFDGRPGLIRVTPDHAELESEGAPFWWAAGFQSGDRTTVLARHRRPGALRGTLVHELTHRFDQAIYGGLPPWLSEGRASFVEIGTWSGGLGRVVEEAAAWNRLWDAMDGGYMREDELIDLLEGHPADYRHNYSAGYSLWLFLRRFRGFDAQQEGPFLFAARVPGYLDGYKRRRPPDARLWFEKHFTDGKDGRPGSLDDFRGLFGKFMREGGSGARPGAEWKQAWSRSSAKLRAADRKSRVARRPSGVATTDLATVPADRNRHDPPPRGLEHARAAATLLSAAGEPKAALAAIDWAVAVDDVDPAEVRRAAELHEQHAGDARWEYRTLLHRLLPFDEPPPAGGPGSTLAPSHRAIGAYLAHLAKWRVDAAAAGRSRLAYALRADHDSVAAATGHAALPTDADEDAAPPPAARDAPPTPWRPAARSLLGATLLEERWSPIDSKAGLPWHVDDAGSVVLGRRRTEDTTGSQIRDAGTRRVFVRTADWLDGSYTVRTRVRFLSSFAVGSLVFGRTERDRGFTVGFQAGDWAYSVGRTDEAPPLQSAHVSLTDHRPADGIASPTARSVVFDTPREFLDVEVRVAGPYVVLLLDGVEQLSHRRLSGAPVEGYVGFALSRGVVRFESPTARTERTVGRERDALGWRLDAPLRLTERADFPWRGIVGRRVEGVPAHAGGTLLVWLPTDAGEEWWSGVHLAFALQKYAVLFTGSATDHVTRLVLPAGDASVDSIAAELELQDVAPASVERHHGHAGLAAALSERTSMSAAEPEIPTWIMLDDRNVVRSAAAVANFAYARSLARLLAARADGEER